jgi:chromosome segregation ATPase
MSGAVDRVKNAGRSPVLRLVCSLTDDRKGAKTHVMDLPADLQRLLAEDFEQGMIDLHAKLESDYYEAKRDRDKLAGLIERQSARIESLEAALNAAGAKVEEQARRIEQLKNEIAAEQKSREKMAERIRDTRLELTKVEHRLEDPFPESSGGA